MEVPYLDREGSSYGPTARGKKTVQTSRSMAYDDIQGMTSYVKTIGEGVYSCTLPRPGRVKPRANGKRQKDRPDGAFDGI